MLPPKKKGADKGGPRVSWAVGKKVTPPTGGPVESVDRDGLFVAEINSVAWAEEQYTTEGIKFASGDVSNALADKQISQTSATLVRSLRELGTDP